MISDTWSPKRASDIMNSFIDRTVWGIWSRLNENASWGPNCTFTLNTAKFWATPMLIRGTICKM